MISQAKRRGMPIPIFFDAEAQPCEGGGYERVEGSGDDPRGTRQPMMPDIKSFKSLAEAMEAIKIEARAEAVERSLPPPIVLPLDQYQELEGGGYILPDRPPSLPSPRR
jgi:hypothetical protein